MGEGAGPLAFESVSVGSSLLDDVVATPPLFPHVAVGVVGVSVVLGGPMTALSS